MRAGMDEGCSTEGMDIAFMRAVRVHGSAVRLCQRRAFSLGLLAGVALFAQPVSAADFGMEWLPLPEGKAYVWPRALEGGEAELKPQPMAVESLPGAVLAELKEAAAGEVLPENVEVWRMNLDGQGEAEWFVSVPPLAGLGGPVYLLLQKKAHGKTTPLRPWLSSFILHTTTRAVSDSPAAASFHLASSETLVVVEGGKLAALSPSFCAVKGAATQTTHRINKLLKNKKCFEMLFVRRAQWLFDHRYLALQNGNLQPVARFIIRPACRFPDGKDTSRAGGQSE